MKFWRVKKKDFPLFLEGLKKRWKVIAPRKERGEHYFTELERGEGGDFNYLNTSLPPKEFLFPSREIVLIYHEEEEKWEIPSQAKPQVIVGIRPCDLKGIKVLDKILGSPPLDFHYRRRRENTLFFTFFCLEPGKRCFCPLFDSGPFIEKGYDLGFTDLGEDYLVEIGSEKGGEIVSFFPFFKPAGEKEKGKKTLLREKVEKKILTPLEEGKIKERIEESFESSIWQKLGDRCWRCGGCSFICPTCHCFEIWDLKERGERIRVWDSCLFSGFTRLAGDINPRQSSYQRIRQRFFCKFSYTPEKYKVLGCVGCGRCVQVCLGEINLCKVLEEVGKEVLKWEEKKI